MKLLIRRDQRTGGLLGGKMIFVLHVRADIAQHEKDAIAQYKLSDCILYARDPVQLESEGGIGGVAKLWIKHMLNITVLVRDLVEGKTIECKDILEMLAAEEQVKTAAQNFVIMLRAAMGFGGEEVVEL